MAPSRHSTSSLGCFSSPAMSLRWRNRAICLQSTCSRRWAARVIGVPVDSEGLVVEALPAEARAVYVTPSHQYPLGVAMSLSRRRALLTWAEHHHAVVVEDD